MPPLTDEQVAKIRSLKIPVDSFYPSTYWIASIDYDSVMPTDDELRMIWSFIEYQVKRIYNLTYQERIFAKPFPADGGHNTHIFRKGSRWLKQAPLYEKDGDVTREFSEGARLVNGGDPCEGWVYRQITWEQNHAPLWPKPRLGLVQLLDRINTLGEDKEPFADWVKWKAEHPDIFPAV